MADQLGVGPIDNAAETRNEVIAIGHEPPRCGSSLRPSPDDELFARIGVGGAVDVQDDRVT